MPSWLLLIIISLILIVIILVYNYRNVLFGKRVYILIIDDKSNQIITDQYTILLNGDTFPKKASIENKLAKKENVGDEFNHGDKNIENNTKIKSQEVAEDQITQTKKENEKTNKDGENSVKSDTNKKNSDKADKKSTPKKNHKVDKNTEKLYAVFYIPRYFQGKIVILKKEEFILEKDIDVSRGDDYFVVKINKDGKDNKKD